MTDGPEGQVPERQPKRQPDSIWERYLTGKLSLTDKETLPALIQELHREIAEHLGKRADKVKKKEAHLTLDPTIDMDPPIDAPMPPLIGKPRPVIDFQALRADLPKRRPSDPRRN
jgi:hypothetical protein